MAKTHLTSPLDSARTRCGLPIDAPEWAAPLPIAAEVADATCVLCLRRVRAEQIDALEIGEDEAPYVAPGPHALSPEEYAARMRSRTLTRTGARAIEVSEAPREERERTFGSAAAALRAYVHSVAEGASMRSTCDPDRAIRVQCSRDPSLGGREHAAVDRYRTASLALDRAMEAGARLVPLTIAQCRAVWLLAAIGLPQQHACETRLGREKRKGTYRTWVSKPPREAAELASERLEVEVTESHVRTLLRLARERMQDAGLASGELGERGGRASREDGAERPARTWDPAARVREAGAREPDREGSR